MPGMRDLFAHFYALDEDAVKAAVLDGIVAPDTNVLLNLYRFQGGAREDLFGALESLKERLWIPHQVGLEFQRRRIGVIADQEQYFTSTQRDLKQLIDSIRGKAEVFPTRIGLNKERTQDILRRIGNLSAILNEEISKAGRANEVRIRNSDSDKVLQRLEALVDGHIGKQMTLAELETARAEARRRVEAGIPRVMRTTGRPTQPATTWSSGSLWMRPSSVSSLWCLSPTTRKRTGTGASKVGPWGPAPSCGKK